MQIIIVAKNANVKLCFLMYHGCLNANANDDFLRQQNNFWDEAAIVDHSSFFWYLMILLDDKNYITHCDDFGDTLFKNSCHSSGAVHCLPTLRDVLHCFLCH